LANEARRAEEARIAEQERLVDVARRAEEERLTEEKQLAKEARRAYHEYNWNENEEYRTQFILFGGTEWLRGIDGWFFLSDMPIAIAWTIARITGNTKPFLWLVGRDSAWWKRTIPLAHVANLGT